MACRKSVAGEVGIEPTNAGIKIRCLTTWRLPRSLPDSSIARTPSFSPVEQRMPWQTCGHETPHRFGHLLQHRLRDGLGLERTKNAGAGPGHCRRSEAA